MKTLRAPELGPADTPRGDTLLDLESPRGLGRVCIRMNRPEIDHLVIGRIKPGGLDVDNGEDVVGWGRGGVGGGDDVKGRKAI